MIIIETQYPQSNKKVKDNERWKVNKVEERLNFINNSDISQKHRDLNFGPLRRGVLVPHGKYTFLFHGKVPSVLFWDLKSRYISTLKGFKMVKKCYLQAKFSNLPKWIRWKGEETEKRRGIRKWYKK